MEDGITDSDDIGRHVQLPNSMCEEGLRPEHLLVYLSIKRFMDSDYKAYPSLRRISELSGLGINKIKVLIGELEKKDYFAVERCGRGSVYHFNKYKAFEPFSYDFLDNKNLSGSEKAYIVAIQQYMYKEEEGIGKVGYSNRQLARKINVSEHAIRKYDKALEAKGYLAKIAGGKEFNLAKIGQMIVWVLKNHEDRITENTENINEIKEDNKKIKENYRKAMDEIEMLKEEIRKLKGSGKEFVM